MNLQDKILLTGAAGLDCKIFSRKAPGETWGSAAR